MEIQSWTKNENTYEQEPDEDVCNSFKEDEHREHDEEGPADGNEWSEDEFEDNIDDEEISGVPGAIEIYGDITDALEESDEEDDQINDTDDMNQTESMNEIGPTMNAGRSRRQGICTGVTRLEPKMKGKSHDTGNVGAIQLHTPKIYKRAAQFLMSNSRAGLEPSDIKRERAA